MAGMTRVKSGAFKARKGIPKDVRDHYQALYGVRWEELFRAPAGCPLHRAKVLRSEWEAEIDSRIAALRAKQRGEGHDLSHREAFQHESTGSAEVRLLRVPRIDRLELRSVNGHACRTRQDVPETTSPARDPPLAQSPPSIPTATHQRR